MDTTTLQPARLPPPQKRTDLGRWWNQQQYSWQGFIRVRTRPYPCSDLNVRQIHLPTDAYVAQSRRATTIDSDRAHTHAVRPNPTKPTRYGWRSHWASIGGDGGLTVPSCLSSARN